MQTEPNGLLEEAKVIEARIASAIPAITLMVKPPFTPAKRAKIARAMSATEHDRHALQMLCNRGLLHSRNLQTLAQLHLYQRHLTLWLETASILRGLRSRPRQSVKSDLDVPPIALAYEQCFYHLQRFLAVDSVQAETENADGRYADVPLPFSRFLTLALLARRVARAVGHGDTLGFLDVGCGAGLKVLQASTVFESVSGLEFDTARAQAARGLMGPRAQIITGDALAFEDYGHYEVVYAYQPLFDPDMMIFTEKRILQQAKPGTVLIMPYADFETRHGAYDCAKIDAQVYVAGLSPAQIDATQRHLPLIGHCLPNPRSPHEGFAKPLRDAMRRWGYLG